MGLKPIYEQRTITAKFQCTYASKEKLRMEPVERLHPVGDGHTTELLPFTINLNDEIRNNLGVSKIADVKEFTLTVQVLAGYEMTVDA